MLFHVLNRGVGRIRLFLGDADFEAFEGVAYYRMSNHWHMVQWPQRDGALRILNLNNWTCSRTCSFICPGGT
jgi:hypothetical protein